MQLNPIYFTDDKSHIPEGKCSFHFSLLRIGKISLSNVWYVPKFQNNLLSLMLIRQGGHQIIMQNSFVKINSVKHNLKIMMNGYEDEKLLRI